MLHLDYSRSCESWGTFLGVGLTDPAVDFPRDTRGQPVCTGRHAAANSAPPPQIRARIEWLSP
jgi:hypothetical protein